VKLALTEAERAVQLSVREFLAGNRPDPASIPTELDARISYLRDWQRKCYEAGLVGRSWPSEFGGGGATVGEQLIIDQELAAAGAPEFIGIVGLDVLGPSILEFGTDEQKRRFVPAILSAQEIWCQGFSEPEAGSDLAALRTRAVDDGDNFIVSGQKTWTSWGQFARWCGALVRTEPDAPRHRGISMLVIDMDAPGVEVRPMEQPTGHAEFCELFLDEVVVPKENLLGQRGQGWAIAMYTLGHERGTASLPRQVKLKTWLDRLVSEANRRTSNGVALGSRETARLSLARAQVAVEVLRHHGYRTVGSFLDGGEVGPEGSTVKLLTAQVEQQLAMTALEILGTTLDDGGSDENEFWNETYLYSRAASVYGGSAQIQRDIIANRVLRLPTD
jgi:alkylation response protein AidB-like acyl-CoA dehydrogenase